MTKQKKPHYTPKEVAGLLGVRYQTVIEWIDSGKLDAWKTPGGQWRINADTLPKGALRDDS